MLFSTALLLILIAVLVRWVLPGTAGRGDRQLEAQHTAELARLRDEMDQLSAQVATLQEEQSFTMRLLTQGGEPASAALPPAHEAPPTPNTTEMP